MTFSSTCRKNPTARVYFIVISLIAEIKKLDILSRRSTVVVVVVVVVVSQSSQTAVVILRRPSSSPACRGYVSQSTCFVCVIFCNLTLYECM